MPTASKVRRGSVVNPPSRSSCIGSPSLGSKDGCEAGWSVWGRQWGNAIGGWGTGRGFPHRPKWHHPLAPTGFDSTYESGTGEGGKEGGKGGGREEEGGREEGGREGEGGGGREGGLDWIGGCRFGWCDQSPYRQLASAQYHTPYRTYLTLTQHQQLLASTSNPGREGGREGGGEGGG